MGMMPEDNQPLEEFKNQFCKSPRCSFSLLKEWGMKVQKQYYSQNKMNKELGIIKRQNLCSENLRTPIALTNNNCVGRLIFCQI